VFYVRLVDFACPCFYGTRCPRPFSPYVDVATAAAPGKRQHDTYSQQAACEGFIHFHKELLSYARSERIFHPWGQVSWKV